MDYFNARYFGSALGRFTSPDPMNAGADATDPQTWNGYAYVRNNPLNATDPSGMIEQVCDDWSCGGWGGEPCFTFDASCGGPGPVPPCIWCGGGGGTQSGGGGGGAPSQTPPASPAPPESIPPGSFPGGENLGLPPWLAVPGPWGIDTGCDFGPCGILPGLASPWSSYQEYQRAFLLAAVFLRDFATGGGYRDRTYYSLAPESIDLERSGGFRTALQRACSSGRLTGPFNVGSGQAALNLPHDIVYSPTGVQVGGYLGSYSFKGPDIQVIIHNEAGANSFFYHGVPNSPSAQGPFRTINQDFSIYLANPCGR